MIATNECQNNIPVKDINSLLKLLIPFSKLSTDLTYDSELDSFYLQIRNSKKQASCPICGKPSLTVHSKYRRVLQHFPIFNKQVWIYLMAKKYRCHNPKCECKIFCEQIEGLTKRYSRKTTELQKAFEKVLVEVSARKGTYILKNLGFKISLTTCLRIVHNMDIPTPQNLTAVGIDDWAYRKGMVYGSIVIDQETSKPVDMIWGRNCTEVKNWLAQHKQINIVTRDRATGFASSIREALPNANQIADKFHLVKNANERVEEEIRKQYLHIKRSYLEQKKDSSGIPNEKKDQENSQCQPFMNMCSSNFLRHIQMIINLQICKSKGMSRRGAAKQIGINKCTANKYWDSVIPPEIAKSSISNYMEDIEEGHKKGLSNEDIFNRITQKGFKGEMTDLEHWITRIFCSAQQKEEQNLEVSKQEKENIELSMLTIRKLAIHTTNSSWGINEETGEYSKTYMPAKKLIESSELLQYLREFSMSFRDVLKGKDIGELEEWLKKYKDSPYKNVAAFVNGIYRDKSAVDNAIIYSWTNGVVEGSVNRLKAIKRGMYGRAGFELLRRKVCLSVTG